MIASIRLAPWLALSRLVLFDLNSTVELDAACRGTYHETRPRTLVLQACTTALCGIPYARGPVFENVGSAGCGVLVLESGLAFGNSNTVLRRIAIDAVMSVRGFRGL